MIKATGGVVRDRLVLVRVYGSLSDESAADLFGRAARIHSDATVIVVGPDTEVHVIHIGKGRPAAPAPVEPGHYQGA